MNQIEIQALRFLDHVPGTVFAAKHATGQPVGLLMTTHGIDPELVKIAVAAPVLYDRIVESNTLLQSIANIMEVLMAKTPEGAADPTVAAIYAGCNAAINENLDAMAFAERGQRQVWSESNNEKSLQKPLPNV